MSSDGESQMKGTFELEVHLEGSGEKIAEIYWDCPYLGSNKLAKPYVREGYDISIDGFNTRSGPLGKATITVLVVWIILSKAALTNFCQVSFLKDGQV